MSDILTKFVDLAGKVENKRVEIDGALKRHNLCLSSYAILEKLYNDPEWKTLKEVAENSSRSQSQVSRLVSTMLKTNMLESKISRDDARCVRVKITKQGTKAYQDAKKEVASTVDIDNLLTS